MSELAGGKVFTLGHSTLSLENFTELLKAARVTVVVDVRSVPFSRRTPHFNRNDLREALKRDNIKYGFLGRELGGRPGGKDLYCNGVADYEKMAKTPSFKEGLERIIVGSKDYALALVCSERDPLDCHRCLLVGRALRERKVSVNHILQDGRVIDQFCVENRLLELVGFTDGDMFASREDELARAYRARAREVAYRLSDGKEPPALKKERHIHAV